MGVGTRSGCGCAGRCTCERSSGLWYRRGSTIVVLPPTADVDSGLARDVSIGEREVAASYTQRLPALIGRDARSPGARVLTYASNEVIDQRISIPAQHALVRLSKNEVTSADAVGMLEEIKAGRLAGIYCVNWQPSAQRSLRLGKSWWTIIPKDEDAVLMLDPDAPDSGPPMMAFRRELDPNCGLLKGEARFPSSPVRLDAALRKAWSTYLLFRGRRLTACRRVLPGQDVIAAESAVHPALSLVPRNLAPPIFCSVASGDPGEVRARCGAMGCPLFAKCDDGTEMFLTDCGRGPCPFCPPGFDELLVRAWCVYSTPIPGRWGIILVLAFGAKTPLICLNL